MPEKKRRIKYWVFKILGILVSCALPIFAVLENFPVWTESHGTARAIGVGGIISIIVVLVVFRKAVFDFMKDKMKLQHAPPMLIWAVLLVVAYILMYINQFMHDLTIVLWMGLVGCTIGTVLTYIAENWYGMKEDGNGGA
jgi:hypothetical protein